MPRINPEILVWARKTAGLSVEEAARAVNIGDAYGLSGADRLTELEAGKRAPTRSQLVRMSQKYRRSLLVFYLNHPPRPGDRGQDFRTVPGADTLAYDATLDALIRDVNARQSLVKSLLEDEETAALEFIGSGNVELGAARAAAEIIRAIELDVQEFRNQVSYEDAFTYLRSKIEAAGIFVLLMGNLGSHHTNISAKKFRGFALADPIAPFIIVNDQDARAAWSFTALHEIAHLWLGTTGISGGSVDAQIERFCNDVAGEILLQRGEIQTLAGVGLSPFDEAVQNISKFADSINLSRALVAYNLFRHDLITEDQWRELKDYFYQDWLASKARRRESRRGDKGGPSYYVVRRHRLGTALLDLVNRSISEGALTPTKAGKVLGVKPRNVEPLLHDIPQRGGL